MAAPAPSDPKPPEAAKEPEPLEPALESLLCKSSTLKVSIHCPACARKVKKILQSIDGVYDINIDLKQQKVVVKGNVDTEALIKQLTKTGKRAELWPETAEVKKKKKKKKKKKGGNTESQSQVLKEKQSEQGSSDESNPSGDENHKNDKETVKVVVQDTAPKNVEGGVNIVNVARNPDGPICTCGVGGNRVTEGMVTGRGGVQFHELRPEVWQPMTYPGSNPPPPMAEKRVTIAVPGNDDDGPPNENLGDRRFRMKGQKGYYGNEGVAVVEHSSSGPNHHHHICHQHHHPSARYGTSSYYTPSHPYSSAYHVHHGTGMGMEAPPYDSEPYYIYTSLPSNSCSFECLSDENPNGCSIM